MPAVQLQCMACCPAAALLVPVAVPQLCDGTLPVPPPPPHAAVTYNALLECCCKTNDEERAEEIVNRMLLAGVQPDSYTLEAVRPKRSMRSLLWPESATMTAAPPSMTTGERGPKNCCEGTVVIMSVRGSSRSAQSR